MTNKHLHFKAPHTLCNFQLYQTKDDNHETIVTLFLVLDLNQSSYIALRQVHELPLSRSCDQRQPAIKLWQSEIWDDHLTVRLLLRPTSANWPIEMQREVTYWSPQCWKWQTVTVNVHFDARKHLFQALFSNWDPKLASFWPPRHLYFFPFIFDFLSMRKCHRVNVLLFLAFVFW